MRWGETYQINFEKYYNTPNMQYNVINSTFWNTKNIKVKSNEMFTKLHSVPIYNDKNPKYEIASKDAAVVVQYALGFDQRIYYLAFFDMQLNFYLYDISNYYNLDDQDSMIKHVKTISLKGNLIWKHHFDGCTGLAYNDDITFYTLCWINIDSPTDKQIYITKVKGKGLGVKGGQKFISLSVSSVGPLKTKMWNVNKFAIAYYRYIIYLDNTESDLFWLTDFDEKKKLSVELGSFCIKGLVDCMKSQVNNLHAEFTVGDIEFYGEYLFITDVNYGIFVGQIEDDGIDVRCKSCYLYALTTGPNKIKLEKITQNEYQIIVDTISRNEMIIFEPIQKDTNSTADSILKLERVHAFNLPKYYSLAMKNANSNFMINELYNSMERGTSFRIMSRKFDTLNDSTMKIIDTTIPIGSVIYMGFIEDYSNMLLVVTSIDITLYKIERPRLIIEAPHIPPKSNLQMYDHYHYWLDMGGINATGVIYLFPSESSELVTNKDITAEIYYKLYDNDLLHDLGDLFIGPDQQLQLAYGEEQDGLELMLIQPLHMLYNTTVNFSEGFVQFGNYVTSFAKLRNHLIFISTESITYVYNDVDYFDVKVPVFKGDNTTTINVRGSHMLGAAIFSNDTYINKYLYVLSVVDNEPSFHVFIISSIVSWIKEIKLTDITKMNYKVDTSCDIINFITCQNVIVVHAYEYVDGNKVHHFFFYKLLGPDMELFSITETKIANYKEAKNVRIEDGIYYLIYDNLYQFGVFTLDRERNQIHKTYMIDIPIEDTKFITGKVCGQYWVVETDKHDLILFDVSDVIFPVQIMTLPHPSGFIPWTKGTVYFMTCISETHFVIPFVNQHQLESNETQKDTYLIIYDLSKPLHTTLLYKFDMFKINDLKSIVMDTFNKINYLYIYADNNMYVLKAFEHWNMYVPDANINYLKSHNETKLIISSMNPGQSHKNQTINFKSMSTGMMLTSYTKKITIRSTEEEPRFYLNIDDYFEGFRSSINLYKKEGSQILNFTANDWNLANLTYGAIKFDTIEITNSRFNYEMQKSLTPVDMDNQTYLYIDCMYFMYLNLQDEVAIVKSRYNHQIQGSITNTKFIPEFVFLASETNTSLGTMFVEYVVNGEEEIIEMWNVDPNKDPMCRIAINYPLGQIIDYYIYESKDRTKPYYFIVGSISRNSHYSLIRFFEDVSQDDEDSQFRYMSEISASVLDSSKFCLDSLTVFFNFLVFTNHNSLFIIDIEEYIDQPQWFTPKETREIDLSQFMNYYSLGQYNQTLNITYVHIQETCQEHLSMYIFTQTQGIIMLEINKASFYSSRWKSDQLSKELQDTNTRYLSNLKEDDANKTYYLVADGRLLYNYYNYDLSKILYAVNDRMMGILYKFMFEGGYHVYVFRCFNLITHAKSIVYFDKAMLLFSECKSLFIEDTDNDVGYTTFTML